MTTQALSSDTSDSSEPEWWAGTGIEVASEYIDDNGVPRTFRSGPSDPVVFGDGAGTWAEVVVAAPPEAVWSAIVDVDLPSKFSDEYLGGRWNKGGPALGASFVGRNRNSAIGEWELESFVDVFEPARAFGWATSDPGNPGARWRFRLRPDGLNTLLRYEMTIGPGPSGITFAIESIVGKEARIIERRVGDLHANMVRTLDGIRGLVERANPLEPLT